jgi:hypothetical protein
VSTAVKPAGGLQPTGLSRAGMAPLLARLLEKWAASGLPPAYLVKDEEP